MDKDLAQVLEKVRIHIETKGPIGAGAMTVTQQRVPETKAKESSLSVEPDGQRKTPTEKLPLSRDRLGQEQLTKLLYQAYASQQVYGDKAAMMEYRDQMFQIILADYAIDEITAAFVEHVKRKTTLPSPADIVNIIDPPAPKPDWAAYVGIKHKMREGSVYVDPKGRAYVAWCEQYVANQLHDHEERTKAKAEISSLEVKLLPLDQA